MSFCSQALLRCAVPLAGILVLSACTDDRPAALSGVAVIDVPLVDVGPQANTNISNPTLTIPATFAVSDGDQLSLVWNEEFDGPAIDPEVWFFATGDGTEKGLPGGWGNNELQHYLPDNAQIVNGALEITARRETVGNLNYTSARINTEDRFAVKYGRIEASIKLPAGQGIWPAFWMLSQDSPYGTWAASGEIDIMEAINLDGTGGNEIFGTIHYGGAAPANLQSSTRYTPSVDVTEDFHTYALEWDEFEFRWYFDGQLYAMENSWSSSAAPYPAPFDQPFHILLNVAVGGNFPGSPNGATPFPVTMAVDWVRVYSGEEPAPDPADPGIIPQVVVYASDPNVTVDLPPPAGIQDFGSGATFNSSFPADADFSPALQVTSGTGYGVDVGFAAIPGYPSGFAAGYETFSFKVKGLPTNVIEVKFFDPFAGDGNPPNEVAINYNVTTYAGSTALGNGWYQLVIPLTDFSAFIDINQGFLLGPPGAQAGPFTFLLTDIGFNGTAGGGGGGGGTGGTGTVLATFDEVPPPAVTPFGGAVSVIETGPAGGDGSNALKIVRNGGEVYAGAWVAIPAIPSDAGTQTVSALVYSPTAGIPMVAKAEFGDNLGTGDVQANETVVVGWQTLTWTFPNFDAAQTYNRFTILPNLGVVDTATSYFFDDITLVGGGGTGGGGGGGGASGELAINGGFETGAFNDGSANASWQQFPGDGIQTITTVNPSSGTYAANLTVPVRGVGDPAVDNLIKNANLQAGNLTPGASITVSFDLRGSLSGAGGVVFAELFSELSGGGTSKSEILSGGPLTPVTAWTPYSFTTTLGPDVNGGVTLQLKTSCGPVVGCGVDVFFDNVSITTP